MPVFVLGVQRDDDGDGRRGDPEASEGAMNRFGNVLKLKVLRGVLVAGMVVPAVAGVPMPAQSRGGYGAQGYGFQGQGYAPTGYRDGYRGDGYRDAYRYNDYDRHHGVGPGKGALIGGAAGLVLGGILGGGKGALIGGAAGAGVGAVAGAANRDSHRGYGYGNGWRGGYDGYGYSNNGYAYGGPYRRY